MGSIIIFLGLNPWNYWLLISVTPKPGLISITSNSREKMALHYSLAYTLSPSSILYRNIKYPIEVFTQQRYFKCLLLLLCTLQTDPSLFVSIFSLLPFRQLGILHYWCIRDYLVSVMIFFSNVVSLCSSVSVFFMTKELKSAPIITLTINTSFICSFCDVFVCFFGGVISLSVGVNLS